MFEVDFLLTNNVERGTDITHPSVLVSAQWLSVFVVSSASGSTELVDFRPDCSILPGIDYRL
jgi:hypothetical protein